MGLDIRMVALDLDGTALNRMGEFSKKTRDVFKKAHEKGIHIVIATGRTECSLPKILYETLGIEYVITSNGSRVLDIVNDKTIYENYIHPEAIERVHQILKEEDVNFEIFMEGRAYISQKEYDGILNGTIVTRSRDYVMATREPVFDISSLLLNHSEHIENISVNYPNEERRRQVMERLSLVEGITLTSSFPLNNEIGGATTSKADALNHLLGIFNLEKNNLMACGDSPNDAAMIRFAGIGVAMGNALDDVKAEADYVTLSNDEDGVAIAIEKYAL